MSGADHSGAPNKAHALDGGIPSQFSAGRRWPAASDEHRWAALRRWAQPS